MKRTTLHALLSIRLAICAKLCSQTHTLYIEREVAEREVVLNEPWTLVSMFSIPHRSIADTNELS